ncbi:TAXI family TRAP transporter solute-binding subunit [Roseomonas sp. HF4]|uniref:TAXI family TRAP transporter solute-binding subunit n=1 Tax=Roseomonas sp. HF4 TaxID=2562313 RepID=UPI0010C12343|nr:TAXI family TRAP transporter solute-binding subunit [Roseomonas sp. HF4]
MMRRILASTGLAVALGFAVLPGSAAAQGQAPQQLTIFTGPQGGSWYAMGGGLARIFQEAGVRASSEVGGGVSNLAVVSAGRGEMGFTMSVVPPAAAAGQAPFRAPITNLRSIGMIGPNHVHIVVAADSGVQSLADLRGRPFASQPVGNVTTEAFRLALRAAGMSEEDLQLTRGGQGYGASQMKDRRVVGFTATTLLPSPAFLEVAQSLDVRFLPIDGDLRARMRQLNPGFRDGAIPADTYRGQVAAVPTVVTDQLLFIRADMSDDQAYWIARTMAQNIAKLRAIHVSLANLQLAEFAQTSGMEFHPGAARYWREAGVLR